MKMNKSTKIAILLMMVSAVMLFSAFVYYDLLAHVKEYKYSDNEEYESINEGMAYLKKLPIHFNIVNKYFSDINSLIQFEKEEIVMAYAIKNKYKLYNCGPSDNTIKYLCIDKKDLNSDELLKTFNLKLEFTNKMIEIYVDDMGSYTVTSSEKMDYYRVVLDDLGKDKYHLYSKFSHYKKEGKSYIFYLYQGYYRSKCKEGEKLELLDFISGKKVYTDKCNKNHSFVKEPTDKSVKKLQLYKYELKRNKEGDFYLAGYNPVKK